ncbi:hypothetical protein BDV98DRAFT_606154 [Pterulicium gracile]|uniref:F-box domain-containing protein n=1 Tax=Pterulicium gracile TaxID=1884261 RepID=A0A5C3QDP1_9AGAR|nr:hypothetical protein BDV98DRAFT_606154 [Pterula gracilis]
MVEQLQRSGAVSFYGVPSTWDIFPTASPVFPFLQTLAYAQTSSYDPKRHFPRLFQDTPLLESLAFSDIAPAPSFPPSWKTITTLNMSYCRITAMGLVDLLRFTEKLEKLTTHRLQFPNEDQDDPPLHETPIVRPALLSHLTQLHVMFSWPPTYEDSDEASADEKVLQSALPHIRCPNLTTICISAPSRRDLDIEAVRTCILSSDNPSSILSIVFAELGDKALAEPIINLLSKLPRLEFISIGVKEDRHVDYNLVVDALRWPQHHETLEGVGLCPGLRSMKLSRCRVDSTSLHDMIMSRTAQSGLRHVVLEDMMFTDKPLDPFVDHLE